MAVGLAQAALVWLAGEPRLLGLFLSQSGADPGALRGLAADPAFLGSVLDFLLEDDGRVLAFAAAAGHRPEDVGRRRAALPGGATPDWT